eukprot:2319896-Pyramimonas_sp.AAC.1
MPDIIIGISVQPGAADRRPVADLMGLAGGGQDGLAKRGDRLHKSAEKLAIIFTGAHQNGGIALNGIKTP